MNIRVHEVIYIVIRYWTILTTHTYACVCICRIRIIRQAERSSIFFLKILFAVMVTYLFWVLFNHFYFETYSDSFIWIRFLFNLASARISALSTWGEIFLLGCSSRVRIRKENWKNIKQNAGNTLRKFCRDSWRLKKKNHLSFELILWRIYI